MAGREVVALNETTPQLEAPQVGDTYLMPRDVAVTGVLSTTGGVLAPGVFNNQTGTTYTIVAGDNGKVLTFNNAASIAVTLPDTLDTNFQCSIVQIGAGVPTVTPATDTINGAGTGVTPSAQWKAMYLSQYAATTWLAVL